MEFLAMGICIQFHGIKSLDWSQSILFDVELPVLLQGQNMLDEAPVSKLQFKMSKMYDNCLN